MIARTVGLVVAYGALTGLLTWPLPLQLGSHVLASGPFFLGDILLIVWATTWGAHALATDPSRLFEGNTFYPSGGAVLGSDHFLGTLPVFAPVWAATGNPIAALNVHLWASVALSGVAMHVLVRRWTESAPAAWVAGIAFTVAPWRVLTWGTAPQMLATAWLPLVLLWLDQALVRPGGRAVALAAGALGLEIASSFYLGYVALALAAAYVTADVAVRGTRGRAAVLARAAGIVAGALVLVAPVTVPYLREHRPEVLPMPLQDTQAFAAWARNAGSPWVLARDYAGASALLLALFLFPATLLSPRSDDDARRVRVLALVVAILLALVLAPGPGGFAGGRVVVHYWIAAWLPGFARVRYTHRFGILASAGTSALAGLAVAHLLDAGRRRRAWRLAAPAAIATAITAQAAVSGWPALAALPVPTGSAVPAVYRWLAAHGGGDPVLEVPTGYDVAGMTAEARVAYFSLYHWSPMLNGVTGYPPPQSWFLKRYWTQLPGAEALALLARCTGVRWIVVHPGTPARGAGWAALAGVRLRETFPGLAPAPDRLFEVIDRAPAACRDRLGQDAVTMDGTPVEHLAELVGTLGVETLPATLEAGGETLVTVVLANAGPIAWPATARSSRDRFALELTWDGADAEWIALPADVRPGETRRFSVWIHHPARSGRHRLAVTAAQGDFLFEHGLAPPPLRWEATVEVGAPRLGSG